MTAIEQAAALYIRHIGNRSFLGDVLLYLKHGCVISMPELFVMGRAVRRDADRAEIVRPDIAFRDPNAWHIAMAVGPLPKLIRLLPFQLPWICWERKFQPVMRFYRTENLLRRFSHA